MTVLKVYVERHPSERCRAEIWGWESEPRGSLPPHDLWHDYVAQPMTALAKMNDAQAEDIFAASVEAAVRSMRGRFEHSNGVKIGEVEMVTGAPPWVKCVDEVLAGRRLGGA